MKCLMTFVGGSMGAAKLLVQHGATALVRNKEGDSPASSALSSGT